MGIDSLFYLVLMISLAIVSVSSILISLVSTVKQYGAMKKQGDEFVLNPTMLYFTVFIPAVYLSTLGFVLYML